MIKTYVCKICRAPLITDCEDSTPPEWLDRLRKLLTCNVCYDRRIKFHGATRRIYAAWTAWIRLKIMRLKQDAQTQAETAIRSRLTSATHDYANVMGEYRNLRPQWQPEMIDVILDCENESKLKACLKAYREGLRQIAQTGNVTLPYAD